MGDKLGWLGDSGAVGESRDPQARFVFHLPRLQSAPARVQLIRKPISGAEIKTRPSSRGTRQIGWQTLRDTSLKHASPLPNILWSHDLPNIFDWGQLTLSSEWNLVANSKQTSAVAASSEVNWPFYSPRTHRIIIKKKKNRWQSSTLCSRDQTF